MTGAVDDTNGLLSGIIDPIILKNLPLCSMIFFNKKTLTTKPNDLKAFSLIGFQLSTPKADCLINGSLQPESLADNAKFLDCATIVALSTLCYL